MSEKSILRKHWKLIINLVTIAALLFLIYAIRHQIGSTIKNFAHINGWALLLIIPIEIIDYHAQAKMYQKMFATLGNKLSYSYLYKASLELNLVNHLFPSGGITGISYFGVTVSGSNDKVSGGKATLVQMMKLVVTLLSFEILLILGVFSLAIVGRVSELTILVGGGLTMFLLTLTFVGAYIFNDRQRINAFFGSLTKALNYLIHKVFKKRTETISVEGTRKVFDDFHDSYKEMIRDWRQLKAPFFYALLANTAEVMAIYVVFLAFGKTPNIGAVILAYGVANFAGLISVLPGGIGIYEALMIAVLAISGVPTRISLPVIIMYRVVNTAIQLPPGYYYYHKSMNKGKVKIPG